MDWQSLSQAIWKWSAQLDFDLDRFPAGAQWKYQLRTAEIAALVPTTVDAPPAEAARQQLQAILDSQRAAISAPLGRRVASLPSFEVLQAALAEYTTPPEQRLRRQLYVAAGDLNQSLERFNTGAGWQKFLTVSPGMALSSQSAAASEPALDAAELTKSLARFASVEQNRDYQMIAAVPAFKATQARLTAYLSQSQHPAMQMPAAQTPEELPAPKPSANP